MENIVSEFIGATLTKHIVEGYVYPDYKQKYFNCMVEFDKESCYWNRKFKDDSPYSNESISHFRRAYFIGVCCVCAQNPVDYLHCDVMNCDNRICYNCVHRSKPTLNLAKPLNVFCGLCEETVVMSKHRK
jgi:hypothetical protein